MTRKSNRDEGAKGANGAQAVANLPVSTRPTQRQIARACGVSQMAVSLALRNSPKVSASVRKQIQRVAKKLNWRPDPTLAALINYRHFGARSSDSATIAWVTNWPTKSGWKEGHPVYLAYFKGAQARAESLGYKLEEFWLGESGMSADRLSRILYTRSITGLLLPPQPRAHSHLRLDWDKFAAVTFGFTLTKPVLHVATNYHFRSSILAMRKLRSLGYRRIGILLDRRYDARVDYSWMAGCVVEQRRYPAADTLPIRSLAELTVKELGAYIGEFKPQALLTNFWNVGSLVQELQIAVPDKLGLAYLSVTERDPKFSGINENSFEIGSAALDLLATIIQRHELGVPAIPRRILIEGYWSDGETVRRINQPVDPSTDNDGFQ